MKIKRRFCAVLLAAVLVGVSGAFASAASVEILSPSAGAQLSGSAKVRARVIVQPGEKLDKVILQTSRGDMLRMAPMFADVFEATLDTTRLRNGRQALVVVASAKGGDEATLHPDEAAWGSMIRNWSAEIPVLISNPYHCYWGDLHAHTNYSDGAGLPADAYQFARDKARLDFFAVTDHSPLLTLDEHSDTVAQAERFNQPGRFVTLWGVEATESWGHINFYMTPSPRLPGNLDLLYRAGGEMMLLGHFNHPSVDPVAGRTWRDDFQGFHHSPAADSAMALVEVRDEREERAYIALLDAGWQGPARPEVGPGENVDGGARARTEPGGDPRRALVPAHLQHRRPQPAAQLHRGRRGHGGAHRAPRGHLHLPGHSPGPGPRSRDRPDRPVPRRPAGGHREAQTRQVRLVGAR